MHACSSMYIYDFFYLQEPLKKIRTNISKRIKNSRKPRSTERYLFFTKGTITKTILPEKYFVYINYQTLYNILVIRNLNKKTKHVLDKLHDIYINLDCWHDENFLQRDFNYDSQISRGRRR